MKHSKRIALWAAVAILVLVGVLPLCVMLFASLGDVGNYTGTLGNARVWALFRSSLLLATLSTLVAGTAGVALGILIAKTDLPFRMMLAVVFSLPLLFPPCILAVGWFEVLGRGGLLARWAGPAVGATSSRWLFGMPGVVLVLVTAFMPVVLLLTMTYLQAVNPTLEEAARFSIGWLAILGRITIPLASPGIVLSLVLVFLLSMGEFGAPAFLRVDVFPVASFTQITAFYNFGAATAAALPLFVVALAGLSVEERLLRGKTFQFGWGGQRNAGRLPLGRARMPLCLLVTVTALTVVAVPLGALVWRGLSVSALSEALERAGASAVRSVAYSEHRQPYSRPWGSFSHISSITFLFCLRDVSLPLLLALPGHDTLTARTMTLMANGSAELIAALCLFSMSLTAVPLTVYGVARRLWSRTA